MIEDILAYNKRFVAEKGYEKYITNKYPDKKIAILSCMDTRLTALLPAALSAIPTEHSPSASIRAMPQPAQSTPVSLPR